MKYLYLEDAKSLYTVDAMLNLLISVLFFPLISDASSSPILAEAKANIKKMGADKSKARQIWMDYQNKLSDQLEKLRENSSSQLEIESLMHLYISLEPSFLLAKRASIDLTSCEKAFANIENHDQYRRSGTNKITPEAKLGKSAVETLCSLGIAELIIKADGKTQSLSREFLLKSKMLQTIQLEKDSAYPGHKMKYLAIPLHELLKDMKHESDASVLFTCLDGFSAPIPASKIFESSKEQAVAYIAVEPTKHKWPRLKEGDSHTAGPFYLIWVGNNLSKISNEEWPFQLAEIEVQNSIESQFPQTQPDPDLPNDDPVRKGYKFFMQNCFACHRLNGEGRSQVGPDLNLPFNPTEYLKESFIEQIIRDPQSVRRWPKGRMLGINKESLSDEGLHQLILYLQHMAKRKYAP